MSTTLADVLDAAERLWPARLAEDWDASGLVTGRPDSAVDRILLAVDAVAATVAEATQGRFDVLLTHHPLLLRGVHSIAEDRYKGALLAGLVRADCALLAAHTNADSVPDGVSEVLARRLGLTGLRPLEPHEDGVSGLGRVGRLPTPTTLEGLARTVARIVPATAGGVRVAGDAAVNVETVAVCGGAGDAYLAHPEVLAADVYVTSDLRHHPASEAREQALHGGGPALVDVSHWASESVWLDTAADRLREALPLVEVVVSRRRTDPWDFLVVD